MQAKKPKKIHVTLDYDCPHCDLEFEVAYNTVNKIGKTTCPYCDEIVSFSKISVSIDTKKKYVETKSKPTKGREGLGTHRKSVLSVLSNLGYSGVDCRRIWGMFAKTIESNETEDEIIDRLMTFI